jgi:hypothetical protein
VRKFFETRLLRFFKHLVVSASVAMLFYVQARLEGLFIFMGAVTNAFAFFALHFDGVILRHTGLKRNGGSVPE